jgi:hypothetical protein
VGCVQERQGFGGSTGLVYLLLAALGLSRQKRLGVRSSAGSPGASAALHSSPDPSHIQVRLNRHSATPVRDFSAALAAGRTPTVVELLARLEHV